MKQTTLCSAFLMLICLHLSTEVPISFEPISKEFLNVSKFPEFSKTILRPRVPTEKTASSDEHPLTDIHPLCSHETNPGDVTPCDTKDKFPVCFKTSSGDLTMCHNMNPVNRLCFKHHSNHRLLVSCTNSSINICSTSNTGVRNLKFCKELTAAICLGKQNKLQLCNAARFKRQVEQDPRVPQLDMDGYYLSCEKCKLRVAMKVDDENDERPVIEILSEPRKDDDDDDDVKPNDDTDVKSNKDTILKLDKEDPFSTHPPDWEINISPTLREH